MQYNWIKIKDRLPEEGNKVMTKIDDNEGCRNEQILIFENNLWWMSDKSMYVYYQPTHWAEII